jgi:phenylacetate-CoA ligase
MQHSHRTVGFFKVRGVNINHSEFEDFMFSFSEVNDFRVEVLNQGENDIFSVLMEIRRGSNTKSVTERLLERIRSVFEVRPDITLLENGTLAKEFEKSVKAPRFRDKRT